MKNRFLVVAVLFLVSYLASFGLRNVSGQSPITQLSIDAIIYDVEWNGSGTHLAIATDSGVSIYDENLEPTTVLPGFNGSVSSISWSPDGNALAGTNTRAGTVLIWDVDLAANQFALTHTLIDSSSPDFSFHVSWSPDGSRIAAVNGFIFADYIINEKIQIFTTNNWQEQGHLVGVYHYLLSGLSWSPDSSKVAGGASNFCDEQMVMNGSCFGETGPSFFVNDVTSGSQLMVKPLPSEPSHVRWSPNGSLAVVETSLKLYEPTAYMEYAAIPTNVAFTRIDWGDTSERLLLAGLDNQLTAIDVATLTVLNTWQFPERVRDIDWRVGEDKAVAVSEQGLIHIFDTSALPISSVSSTDLTRPDWGNHNDIDISPNGLLVAVATDNGAYVLDIDLHVVAALEGHLGSVYSVHWHPDGTRLASGGEDGTIRIWDMVESSPSYLTTIQTFQDTGPIYFVGWSPNSASNQIATKTVTRREASSDSIYIVTAIRIWNTQTGQVERTLGDLAMATEKVDWNSDGTLLAGGGAIDPDGYRLVVWNAQDGSIVATSDAQIDPLRSVAWQPNSSIVAVSDVSATLLFDTSTSQPISYVGFDRGTWRLTAVDWNADGSQFATGSYANYLLVYDAATGQVVLELDNSPDFVYALDWGVSGSKIAAIVGKHTIRIFDVDDLPIISGTPTITPIPSLTPSYTPSPTVTATSTPLSVDKIAVTMIEDDVDDYPQFFTIDLNGTNVNRLTDGTEFSKVESPSWSPDGTKIVFAAALPQESTLQIFVANADGSNAL